MRKRRVTVAASLGTISVLTGAAIAAMLSCATTAHAAGGGTSAATVVSGGALPRETRTEVKVFVVPSGSALTLADIAAQVLGDQNRADQLVLLNRGRVQPDGRQLTDQTVRPGWILLLPGDAQGASVQIGRLAGAVPDEVRLAGPLIAETPRTRAAPADPPAGTPKRTSAAGPATPGSGTSTALVWGGIGLVSLAALLIGRNGRARSLLGQLRRWTGPGAAGPPPALEPGRSDVLADPWTIDGILRALAASCRHPGAPAPPVQVAHVTTRRISVTVSPTAGTLPQPWQQGDDRMTWTAPLADLPPAPDDPRAASPYPHLVTVPAARTGRTMLNLAAARGVVALTGDPQLATATALGWITELRTQRWARSTRVLAVGFGRTVVDGSWPGLRAVSTLADAMREIQSINAWRGAGAAEAATARGIESGQPDGVLIADVLPSERELEQLGALAGSGRWSVVVIAPVPGARWTLTCATGVVFSQEVPGLVRPMPVPA